MKNIYETLTASLCWLAGNLLQKVKLDDEDLFITTPSSKSFKKGFI